jgi:hypothetical protein
MLRTTLFLLNYPINLLNYKIRLPKKAAMGTCKKDLQKSIIKLLYTFKQVL